MSVPPYDFRHRARTKIVATVGPACEEEAQLAALATVGADVFRLNMAHATLERCAVLVERIRRVSRQIELPLGVLVDLAGPKIRLGEVVGGEVTCQLDERFDFIRTGPPTVREELTCSYERLVDELQVGDSIMLADGTVGMVVQEKEPSRVRCRVVQGGMIRSRQGVNLPGVHLSAPTLGEEDRLHARRAAELGADFVSLSFVRSADDLRQLRALLTEVGSTALVIAKIEKKEALAALEPIVAAADGVMVARGDLGVEIDVAQMPIEQKRIIATCRRHQKPVIVATQMLDSMQRAPRPTRAEATDVANAILDGADACMLSGETAIGQYPREAVETMNRIALATEQAFASRPLLPFSEHSIPGLHPITRSVVYGASAIAQALGARLVIVASHSGATALAFSNQRSFIPTVGVSSQETTLRRMSLLWGVMPLGGMPTRDVHQLIRQADHWGRATRCLAPGDRVVVVGGSHLAAGGHDILAVHEVGEKTPE